MIMGILLLVSLLLIIFTPKKTEYFSRINLDSTNTVINHTEHKYVDTIIKVGLSRYDLQNVRVSLYYLPDNLKASEGREVKAMILSNDKEFIIYMDSTLLRREAIMVLSHELIHLLQYKNGALSVVDNTPIWMGKKIPLNSLSYESRPWEQEAIHESNALEDFILNKLYQHVGIPR